MTQKPHFRLIIAGLTLLLLVACNNAGNKSETEKNDSTTVTVDSTAATVDSSVRPEEPPPPPPPPRPVPKESRKNDSSDLHRNDKYNKAKRD